MSLLYAREIDPDTKEFEVINQVQAEKEGWEKFDVEFDVFNAKWYLSGYIPEKPAPTREEQEKARASAYQVEADPITAHIQRLRDKEQTEEVVAEIAELIVERDAKVEEIKARFPYPAEATSDDTQKSNVSEDKEPVTGSEINSNDMKEERPE